jgi:CBS domain-containing protein
MTRHIRDMMTPDPITMSPQASILEAAQRMRDAGIGDVIVAEGGQLSGIVTDRDIVVRGIAAVRDPRSTSLAEICSREVTTVSADDRVGTAIKLMRDKAVRRLPVVQEGRPVGILSIGDLAIAQDRRSALADISTAPPNQ